mgnify:CR=1 FL=1
MALDMDGNHAGNRVLQEDPLSYEGRRCRRYIPRLAERGTARSGKVIRFFRKETGRHKEHGNMRIMTAGVHASLICDT